MAEREFKLHTATIAIVSVNDKRTIVTIPGQAVVTILAGDMDGSGLLKIRYREQDLEMFAADLRSRGERVK